MTQENETPVENPVEVPAEAPAAPEAPAEAPAAPEAPADAGKVVDTPLDGSGPSTGNTESSSDQPEAGESEVDPRNLRYPASENIPEVAPSTEEPSPADNF